MGEITFEFDIPPGLNSDDTTFGAKGRWADGSNVRFRNGRPETIGRIVKIAGAQTVTSPRTMFAYMSSTSTIPRIIIGCDAALNLAGISSIADISPVGLASGQSYWAFDSWGDNLLAAPLGGALYQYTGTGVATVVSAAPANMNHMIVTHERQVMALGANEVVSGTQNPMCIRLSAIEDYSSAGSWTPTSSNLADEIILEGEGKIVAGRRIGAYVAIWTSAALHLGQFVGDPSQSFRFDLVSGGCGLVGPGGVAIAGGVAYWMSPDHRFWQWAPGALPEQMPCPIGIELQTNIAAGATRLDRRVQAVRNSAFNEVWWFYQDSRDSGYRYVALNTADGTWFRGQLDRRAAYHADFLYNPTNSSSVRAWRPFISADGDGYLYSHEVETYGGAGDGEPGFSSYIQSADQYFNSGRQRVMISGINPDFEVQGCSVDLTLYMKDRAQSAPVTKGPYSLAVAASKKDFRASGMIMAFKISLTTSIGTNFTESWRLGKPVFRGATMGAR
jgi:hypothetical protein